MRRLLHISEHLSLPLDWITLATVVYGARGSGKTSLGAVMAEEATKAGQRFCAIDLKGDWYGLKSSTDGKSEGIPVVVFGGDHQDVPLEEGAGAFVGETVANLSQSCILDLEYFSKGKQVRFLSQFFEALYDRNREPLLLLLDEAQRYAPQRPISPDATVCLGMIEDVVKLGRKHGLGPVLFTQRGSGLNKEVSELCDLLVAFRTPGPLDQDRIKDWLDANTTKAERDEVMSRLAGLPTGTAVFASGHPDLKIFGTYPVRRRETFDSSATPKVGQRRTEPKKLAKPDLEQLKTKMAAAIERKKAEDPAELNKVIAGLKREIADLKKSAAPREQDTKRIRELSEQLAAERAKEKQAGKPTVKEKKIILAGDLTRLANESDRVAVLVRESGRRTAELEKLHEKISATISAAKELNAQQLQVASPKVLSGFDPAIHTVRKSETRNLSTRVVTVPPRSVASGNGEVKVGGGALRALKALATRPEQRVTKSQLATLARMKASGGSFGTYMSILRTAGFIADDGKFFQITQEGMDYLGADIPPAPQSSEEILQQWLSAKSIGGKAKDMLILLWNKRNNGEPGLSRQDLADTVGMEAAGGSYGTYLSTLRSNGLIVERDGAFEASDALFI